MRIGELSRESGVSIPTIKYYVREGLLPAGERTKFNQAQYDETHLRRLKLVRALVEVGGLSIAATRDVLSLMDAQTSDLARLGKAQYALTPRREHEPDEAWEWAGEQVDGLLAKHGWKVSRNNPARLQLAEALATLRRLGQDDYLAMLDRYAEIVGEMTTMEVDGVLARRNLDGMAEAIVIWTAIGDSMLTALRRLSQEAETVRRFGETVFTAEGEQQD
ncbi:MerR family transcriptional regulator [Microbispora hainanensis]|uniref:MerR family transcriptional regulator n=1 Tax=Microbispora hainanensis TaxID=568844 RepID=A0ABZ1SSM9_9ACTN|nr:MULTISPECIES: MerR family transcriptional regulator [Microbispora]NJP23049.1 MerR family transcriptional regulator [Microbispora sp. CL1-1]TQS17052.1 MerR family transcriptional regulator [Microbispora sp. SCL1-1]